LKTNGNEKKVAFKATIEYFSKETEAGKPLPESADVESCGVYNITGRVR
jgi:hypothetical protein